MSRKYISQQNNLDFFYPNYNKPEYDIEIVHDVNNNCVSGSVINFSATTVSSSSIAILISDTWSLNGAKPWIRNSNQLGIYSIHMLAPGQDYFKPWRVVATRAYTPITATTYSETNSLITIFPSTAGVTGFTSGTYYFEVRFIGHDCTYNVCFSQNLTIPTPTPTPTSTPTPTPTPSSTFGPTATPTPTPTTSATPTPTPTVGDTLLYVYAKYKDASADLQYSINGDPDVSIGTISTTGCTFYTTITGLTNGDIVDFTSPTTAAIAGDSSNCPDAGFLCGYSVNIVTGTNYVYLTVDGDTIC